MWILPTLSRPKQCAEVLERIYNIGLFTTGIVYVNGPKHRNDYVKSLVLPLGWRVIYGEENLGCHGALNTIFKQYPDEPWYGFIGDDEFLFSDSPWDWDTRLVEAAGDWDVAHGWDDLHQGKRCQGYVVIGGKLARAIGYLAIPDTWHWFGFDNMYEWLSAHPGYGGGGCVQLKYVPEVRVNHRHAYWNKSMLDECYRLGESRNEEDRKVFWKWVTQEMPVIAERIKRLRNENPLTETAAS